MITRSSNKIFYHRAKDVWFSYKYCQFCISIEVSRFNAIVGHLALTHIIKSKAEPTTTRIKCLLEVLSSYSFNIYYNKENI